MYGLQGVFGLQAGGDGLFSFGLGDHAFALVEHREAGVDEEVVGAVLGGLLRRAERLVEVAQLSWQCATAW